MMMPVTSTSVATNGADEVAGSNLNLFKRRGSMEPARVPHKTTPSTETPVTIANKKVWLPYRCGSI